MNLFKLIDNSLKAALPEFGLFVPTPILREQDRASTLLKWLAKHATSRGTYAAIALRAHEVPVSPQTNSKLTHLFVIIFVIIFHINGG